MPPVSPRPECRRRPSTSPWRKSCTTVRPSDRTEAAGRNAEGVGGWASALARAATRARGPPEAATASRAARADGASGAPRHPGSVRRSPRADRAAARTTGASVSSRAIFVGVPRAPGAGTSPRVSTRRARPAGSGSKASAAVRASMTSAGAAVAQVSTVRWASIPVNPPRAVRRTSGATASGCGAAPPKASTACSATSGRSSRGGSRDGRRPGHCPGRRGRAPRRRR